MDLLKNVRRASGRAVVATALLATVMAPALALPGLAHAAPSAGAVLGFGDNFYGQLGNASNNGTDNANPTPAAVTLPSGAGRVTRLAAGDVFTLLATSTGQLYAFGDNHDGELGNTMGNGTWSADPTPQPVTLPGELGTVTQIAAGGGFSLVTTSGGQLYAFGSNSYGQLGNSTGTGTASANPTPTLVNLPGRQGAITAIAAGNTFSLVATSGGQLYAFGVNHDGQLGNSTNNGAYTANPTPTLVTLPGRVGQVSQIAAGNSSSLVATSSGQLYAFGSNTYGQLGTTTAKAYLAPLSATGGTPPDTWSATGLPAGLSIDPATGAIAGTPTAPGTFRIGVALTDAYGSQSAATLTLAIGPATTPPPPPTTVPTPQVTHLRETHARWREDNRASRRARGRRRAPVGTVFTFLLSESAGVRLTLVQQVPGRASGAGCVAQTRRNRHHRRCLRTLTAGVLTVLGHSGVNRVAFRGVLPPHRRLRPGRYTVIVTATAAGKTSAQVRLTFTVVA